jgi:hypothetical protein
MPSSSSSPACTVQRTSVRAVAHRPATRGGPWTKGDTGLVPSRQGTAPEFSTGTLMPAGHGVTPVDDPLERGYRCDSTPEYFKISPCLDRALLGPPLIVCPLR